METKTIAYPLSVPDDAVTKALLRCGVIAGPLFTFMWLIESLTRPGYNLLRHPVSSLALGPFGWMQVANFIVGGMLTLAFAVGLRRVLQPRGAAWGALLIAVWGIGLLGAGVFLTDPVSGYPPGTPAKLAEYSNPAAMLHDMISLVAFLTMVVNCALFTRWFIKWGNPRWAIYSAVTGIIFFAVMFLASAGFAQTPGLVDFAGLYQRIAVTTGWTWITLLAVRLLRDIQVQNKD